MAATWTSPKSEPISIDRPQRRLEGVLTWPASSPRAGVVLCHPHPLYGGNMYNAVILGASRAVIGDGMTTLRFNFGGAGESEGAYTGGPEEAEDTQAALGVLERRLPIGTPLVLVGYSFGAWVALLAARDDRRLAHVVLIAPPLDHLGPETPVEQAPGSISIIAAERDQFCATERLVRFCTEHESQIAYHTTIPGTDHFFAGAEAAVGAACREALRRCLGTPGGTS